MHTASGSSRYTRCITPSGAASGISAGSLPNAGSPVVGAGSSTLGADASPSGAARGDMVIM